MAKIGFTAKRVEGFKCPADKTQAFLWDADAPGLGLRATPAGKPAYIFQSTFQGKSLRITIGSPDAWTIAHARDKARALQRILDDGLDPREVRKAQEAADGERATAQRSAALTVADVWPLYLESGKPKRRAAWKPRYRADLEKMASPGGEKKKRGKGLTLPGPLHPLMALRLAEITEDSLKSWHEREARRGAHQAARALMMFRGFLRWCSTQKEYRDLVDKDAGGAASITESLPPTTRRTDALEAAQLPGWWSSVAELSNSTASAYLRALLLTGARREEMAALKWSDVDFRWHKLMLADKVESTRVIPLTDYMAWMLAGLRRIKGNPYVFASAGESGRISDVRSSHGKALKSAGIDGLTLHGLRRSFSLLGEAAGAPAGAIAQVMGHKPSATAEGYRPRSIDALRPYLAQIESHILAQAGVKFDPHAAATGRLRAIK